MKLESILSCAVSAARKAGQHALENSHRRNQAVATFQHDVKLKLDQECQEIATSVIMSAFPDHHILGEEDQHEDGQQHGTANRACEWVIDPIDGTVNFSHGLPWWCCSIAFRQYGQTTAGVVYAPALNKIYTATTEQASQCNGQVINVSQTERLDKSIVLTGLDKHIDPKIPPFAIFQNLANNTQKARIMGAAAVDICQVACGNADGYFEAGIYLWDIAAAALIVEQAGGKTEILGLQEHGRLRFMASNGRIHQPMKKLVDVIPGQ